MHQEVTSSNLRCIGHDGTDLLTVTFANGREYHYHGVAPATYEQVVSAESVGKAFHAEVVKVHPHCAVCAA
jgi:hypothetical protein